MDGRVVRAERGERSRYQPLSSNLCAGSDPGVIAGALLDLYPFATLYVADLDAIRSAGARDQLESVERIKARAPQLELWIDAGLRDFAAYQRFVARGLGQPVLGSESLVGADWIGALAHSTALLSLDFHRGEFLGSRALLASPSSWPNRLLAMNLDRVGGGAGPDLDLIQRLRALRPDAQVYAAGGVRGVADLRVLQQIKAAGALVASALHDGRLTARELETLTMGSD